MTIKGKRTSLQLVVRVLWTTIGNSGRHAEGNPVTHVLVSQAVLVVGDLHVCWSGWHSIHGSRLQDVHSHCSRLQAFNSVSHCSRFQACNSVITGGTIESKRTSLQLVVRVLWATIGNSGRHAEGNPVTHVLVSQAVLVVGDLHVCWSGWHSIHGSRFQDVRSHCSRFQAVNSVITGGTIEGKWTCLQLLV